MSRRGSAGVGRSLRREGAKATVLRWQRPVTSHCELVNMAGLGRATEGPRAWPCPGGLA